MNAFILVAICAVIFIILFTLAYIFKIYILSLVNFYRKKRFFAFVFILIFPYISFKINQYLNYTSYIPQAIDISWPLIMNQNGLFMDNCGFAIFNLKDNTVQSIKDQGIDFFGSAIKARGSHKYTYAYKAWKLTPIPSNWGIDEPRWLCMPNNNDKVKDITKQAYQAGGFYTTLKYMDLVVLPAKGILIYSFYFMD